MDAEKIRKYLLSLGLDIQEVGGRIFSVLTEVTTNTVKAGRAVENAALSIFTFTEKVAGRLDDLYLTSQRTGMKAEGIEAIGYAVSQVGGRVDEAQGSLEKFAQFVNESPGAEGFLKRLGVQTRDANGEMIDMASTFMSVGQKLSTMSGESADKYAQKLGIDENTLMAMRSGMGQFSEQYNEMTKAIGFDADGAAASSNKFMTSLRAFSQFTRMIQNKIGTRLAEGLAGPLDKLRQRVMEINYAQEANASIRASWHLFKEEVGDVMRDLGINTDFGKRKGTVKGNILHTDIPGGEAPVSAIRNKNLIKKSQGNTIRKSEPYRRLIKSIQPSKVGARLLNSMQPTFARLEKLYHLPTGLFRSVAIAESRGNRFAVSNADAKGLFQFIDPTARHMGLHGDDVFDPMKATQAAAKYLHQLLRANGGDLNKALASYNWGIGHVQKPGMERMPPETRNYIPRVMSNMPQQGVLQQNTYNIYGGDAQTLGTEVERRQQSSNAQLLRGAQAKVG